jgi:hypothetical protein
MGGNETAVLHLAGKEAGWITVRVADFYTKPLLQNGVTGTCERPQFTIRPLIFGCGQLQVREATYLRMRSRVNVRGHQNSQ